jgi:hypothetical protein
LTQNNTFSHLTTKFLRFYFFHNVLYAESQGGKGFGQVWENFYQKGGE